MKLLKWIYEKKNKKPAHYYYDYSIGQILFKPIRKWLTNTLAANCPFNCVRIAIYRLCGFEIGKGTFIGMKCYLDDMCYDLLKIGENVTIFYGVFFGSMYIAQSECAGWSYDRGGLQDYRTWKFADNRNKVSA